jgi:hypothetical protein
MRRRAEVLPLPSPGWREFVPGRRRVAGRESRICPVGAGIKTKNTLNTSPPVASKSLLPGCPAVLTLEKEGFGQALKDLAADQVQFVVVVLQNLAVEPIEIPRATPPSSGRLARFFCGIFRQALSRNDAVGMGSAPASGAVGRASRPTHARGDAPLFWCVSSRKVRREGAPNHSRGGCDPRKFQLQGSGSGRMTDLPAPANPLAHPVFVLPLVPDFLRMKNTSSPLHGPSALPLADECWLPVVGVAAHRRRRFPWNSLGSRPSRPAPPATGIRHQLTLALKVSGF